MAARVKKEFKDDLKQFRKDFEEFKKANALSFYDEKLIEMILEDSKKLKRKKR